MLQNWTVTQHEAAERRSDDHERAYDQVAASYAGFLDLAILRGQDIPVRAWWGSDSYPVSEFLRDSSVEDSKVLFRACHLARAGKYEASSAALLEFVRRVTEQYGRDMADKLAGDEE